MCDIQDEHRHIGKIHVSPATITKWLNMEGATLMNVELNTATWPPGYDFTVEHPVMPPVREGEIVPVIEHDREAPIFTDR